MKKIFKKIIYLTEFKRDMKKLKKRFNTIDEDLNIFIEVQLQLFHKHDIDNGGIVRISNLNIEYPLVYKAKKFSSRSLKGKGVKTGIRVIYSYSEIEDKIEFIEIYYKGDKENEDKNRIFKYYKKNE